MTRRYLLSPRTLALLAALGFWLRVSDVTAALEHHFIFFPSAELAWTPAQLGLAYEEVWLESADGVRVHAWFVPGRAEADLPALLFFHGNAGNLSHRVHNLELLHRRLGLPVLILSYRGYGLSQGRASEQGLYADARAAHSWLEARGYPPARQVYFGRSLGAAVALQLALERPPAGLILESPFTSIAALGRHHYKLLFPLLGWLVEARFDNLDKIARLEAPLLIIHGRRDRIVPPAMAERLFALAPEPKRLLWLERAGHNDTLDHQPHLYWQAWADFLHSLPAASPNPASPP